jgi:hypothetical protein
MKPTWIKQEDSNGCSVAAIAMIVGKTYHEIKSVYFPDHDFTGRGVSWFTIDQVLTEHDFAVSRKFEHSIWGKRPDADWPPLPFAELHICQVIVNESSPLGHTVVMLADGTILDPGTPEPKRLTDYHRVFNVAAVVKVENK